MKCMQNTSKIEKKPHYLPALSICKCLLRFLLSSKKIIGVSKALNVSGAFYKGIQRNCEPVGNFTTCCILSRVYKALVIRFHFYRYDRIVNS